jgi:formylglycine-generating enzyme required for sulfatase activity
MNFHFLVISIITTLCSCINLRAESYDPDSLPDFKEPEMVWVEGGTFSMGSDNGNPNEKPRMVELTSLYMTKFEGGHALWNSLMEHNPSKRKDCGQCPIGRLENAENKTFCFFMEFDTTFHLN